MNAKPSLQEQLRRAAVEKMWLQYFNDQLLVQGIITQPEHKRMQAQLATRKGGGRPGQ